MKRRNFLGLSLALGVGIPSAIKSNSLIERKKKGFRIVHFTDMHIYPSEKVKKALDKLLAEIEGMKIKPDFILNTGDNIMDALKRPKKEVEAQWQSWEEYFRSKLNLPLYSCIGNHDVWGWGMDDQDIKNDPNYGKAWAMEMLGLEKRFYSFEHGGWKFICLDSPHESDKGSYIAKLDEDQFSWLKKELKTTDPSMPVCIASHIPILSVSAYYDGDNEKNGDWQVPSAWMHIDSRKIKDLFYKYPNVKAAISGHIHLADKTEYLGVHYHCNGAVCGGWWNGSYQEFGPAYAIIDFFEDGSIQTELVHYKI